MSKKRFFQCKHLCGGLIFSLLLLTAANGFAGGLTLSWSPPTTNEDGSPLTDLDGYNVYYGTSPGSYSERVNVGDVTTYQITGLTNGVTYYAAVTAYDTSGNESNYSDEVSGTVPGVSPPSVTTDPATAVTVSSAMLNGTVNPNGDATSVWFEWDVNGVEPYANNTAPSYAGSGTTTVTISDGISGLAPNTQYYYRIVAQNAGGTSYGNPVSFTTPQITHTLAVSRTGQGTVTSVPSGINCGSDCSENYADGTSVTLTASPAGGWDFTGWTGCDTVPGSGDCRVSMNTAKTVTATFEAQEVIHTLTVSRTGQGTVTSVPSGINCGSDCSENYADGTSVTLTASPAGGWDFTGWTGCDTVLGSGDCEIIMNATKNVTAAFGSQVSGPLSSAIFSNGRWFFDANANNILDQGETIPLIFPSIPRIGDIPIKGDWNGDGIDDIGVFRTEWGKGEFYLDMNGNGVWDGKTGGDARWTFGRPGDRPVTGDWNGDGIDEIGVFRIKGNGKGIWLLDFTGDGKWNGTKYGDIKRSFGGKGDRPVTGDWNGDGITDIGTARPKLNGHLRWRLDLDGNGSYEKDFDTNFYFGYRGDKTITGDWNEDGMDEVGIVRANNEDFLRWYLDMDANGNYDQGTDTTYLFGVQGYKPLTGRW